MSAPFTIIVPTVLETSLTGYIGAGERTIRGALWRVELHAGEPVRLRRIRNGEPASGTVIAWAEAPQAARRFAHDVVAAFKPVQS